MPPDRTFRRNFLVIAVLHVGAIVAIYLFSFWRDSPKADQVMWLDGGSIGGGNEGNVQTVAEQAPQAPPEPKPEVTPEKAPTPVEKSAPSQLVLPPATPLATTPRPTTPRLETPKPVTPKHTPKPTPHHTPKPKPAVPKATPTDEDGEDSTSKPKTTPAKAKSTPARTKGDDASGVAGATPGKAGGNGAGTGNGKGPGKAGGGAGASEFGWYFSMIHDRFHSRWDQPTTISHGTQEIMTTLKIRISRDGAILNREIVRPSGDTTMDQSVMTAAERVQQIDPLPAGLGNGDFFEINIAFKLDQDQ